MIYQLLAVAMTIMSVSGFLNHDHLKMSHKLPSKILDKAQKAAALRNNLKESVTSVSWSDCTSSNAKGSVSNVTFSPNPPQLGTNSSIIGYGTVSESVSDGSWELVVYDGKLKVDDQKGDICKDSAINLPLNAGTLYYETVGCPISAGDVTVTLVADISTSAPTGTITTDLTAKDSSGNELFCVSVAMVIS